MGSLREAAKRGVAAKQATPQPVPIPDGPLPAKPVQAAPQASAKPSGGFKPKLKPPVVGTEKVTCACGHEAVFELYTDKQDKFRHQRREKLTGRPCPECRKPVQEADQKRQEADKAKREEKQAVRRNPEKVGRHKLKDRLPDGATFQTVYDAGKEQWTGTLTINGSTFTENAGALFRLCRLLDDQYRKSLDKPKEVE